MSACWTGPFRGDKSIGFLRRMALGTISSFVGHCEITRLIEYEINVAMRKVPVVKYSGLPAEWRQELNPRRLCCKRLRHQGVCRFPSEHFDSSSMRKPMAHKNSNVRWRRVGRHSGQPA